MAAAAGARLRIAVVQFAPKIGQVMANIAKARELCSQMTPRSVDLSEAFSSNIEGGLFEGYVFQDSASIFPYLEKPHTGPTSRFCAELALRLGCYVTGGFPELLEEHEWLHDSDSHPPPQTDDRDPQLNVKKGANTAALYGPSGELVRLYRKSNLFETDIPWAVPGTGFSTFSLPAPFGPLTLAICNDLNVQQPAVWTSLEDGPYELAQHCLQNGTRVLVLLNAWLKPSPPETPDEDDTADPRDNSAAENLDLATEPCSQTMNYWVLRLRPLWVAAQTSVNETMDDRRDGVNVRTDFERTADEDKPEKMTVVVCNRFGEENGKCLPALLLSSLFIVGLIDLAYYMRWVSGRKV